jgi:hypothetical protein
VRRGPQGSKRGCRRESCLSHQPRVAQQQSAGLQLPEVGRATRPSWIRPGGVKNAPLTYEGSCWCKTFSGHTRFASSTVELPLHGSGGLWVRFPREAMAAPLTNEEAQKVAALFLEGRNKREIGRIIGRSETAVRDALSRQAGPGWTNQTRDALRVAAETWAVSGVSKKCRACRLLLPNDAEHFQQRGDYSDVRCRKCVSAWYRARGRARRLKALIHYSGDPPRCACCGETFFEFLAIDHIEGGGGKHRREIKNKFPCIIRWLSHHNYPPGFRVLCHNCNCALGHYGYCPHGNLPVCSDPAKVAQEPKAEVDHLGA